MGQRHQLFVIAKIAGGRHRCLAALHHQWLYGQAAVRSCLRLIKIFQEPSNRALLDYEKQLAANAPEELWGRKINYANDVPQFPFVSACLTLGTSLDTETGSSARVNNLPFNLRYDEGDNNDGITVLDITNPSMVRYAFVVPEGQSVETKNFKNTPLTAHEYAASYKFSWDDGQDELETRTSGIPPELVSFLQRQTVLDTKDISAPLIDEATLESAWPGSWRKRTDLRLPGIPAQPATEPQVPAVNDPSNSSLLTLHDAFTRANRFLDPLYEESGEVPPAKTDLGPQIKQIVHIATLQNARHWKQHADCPVDRHSKQDQVKIWTFPVDDVPPTTAILDVVHSWFRLASLWRSADYWTVCSHKPQDLVKCFGLVGTEHTVIKPLPGKAYFNAQMHSSSSATCMECSIADIKPGEWTILVGVDSADSTVNSDFTLGFASRDERGDIVVADAAEFRKLLSSGPSYDAALALDPEEEAYGKSLVDILASNAPNIGGKPVSGMDKAGVLEALDMVERYERHLKLDPMTAQIRKMVMERRKAAAKSNLARE